MPIRGKDQKVNLGRVGKGWEQPEPGEERQERFIPSPLGPCDTPKPDARCRSDGGWMREVRASHRHWGDKAKTPAIAGKLRQPRLILVAKYAFLLYLFNFFPVLCPSVKWNKVILHPKTSPEIFGPPFPLGVENY